MSHSSEHGERIDALDFDAPGSSPSTSTSAKTKATASRPNHRVGATTLATRAGAPWWQSQFNLMVCVFALLATAAGLFIVLTPSPVGSNPTSVVVASDGSASRAAATTKAEPETAAPWDESRRAQARSDSQDILASLLESKKALEAKQVVEWAPKRYQAALDLASSGDELYKQQDYGPAIDAYTSAAEQMESLNNLIPEVLKNKVRQGLKALEEGKVALAEQRFKEALALNANDIDALTGLGRAKVLEDVLKLVNAASDDEQTFSVSDELSILIAAQDKYQQALTLDKAASQAREGLTRVGSAISDKKYRLAMSDGYRSLFANRYSTARKAFSNALKTKPNDVTANAAYRQTLASDKSSSLDSLLSSAKRYEQSEQWASALSNYQAVLQRDPNQVAAKLGEIRTKVRTQLDTRLTESLSDPLLLAKSTQQERVDKVLKDAQGIKNKGPRLKQQIAAIESARQQFDQAINVTLKSDALTDVTLVKEGSKPLRLGKFSNRKLALKPGRYVLSGQRSGFQDVRQELELKPQAQTNEPAQSVDVRCRQPVVAASN